MIQLKQEDLDDGRTDLRLPGTTIYVVLATYSLRPKKDPILGFR